MKFIQSFKTQFKKWVLYNILTFLFLSVFYIPYNVFWLGLSGIQLLKWFLTAAIFGAIVNILMRPYVVWVVKVVERRYGKGSK